MAERCSPINPKFPYLWHGGDYNPDQWLHRPDVLEDDLRLMKLSGCNSMSVGIFAWAALEPEEGRYEFGWLDERMDALHKAGVHVVLATPSGGKPNWMAAKYPEIRRVNKSGQRELQHRRHNHCFTSPVYREKVAAINARLAERYAEHPALALWHLSNEYSGECHCDLCKAAFRDWLKDRYTSLDELNGAWWSAFWATTLTDWDELLSMDIDGSVDAMVLDWKRFVTHQTVDFMKAEIAPLREHSDTPVTTNFMGFYEPQNYWKFAEHLDVISDDCYPMYHDRGEDDITVAVRFSMAHDMCRSLKQRPFLIMESSPSATNWMPVHKLKRPGVHRAQAVQHLGHGAESIKYFQWRKGQGAHEKFHGAVVDHVGHENTRVFQDVADVGGMLGKLDGIIGTMPRVKVGLICDWEVRWALESSCGPMADQGRSSDKDYMARCEAHYRPFWQAGVSVDVIDSEQPLNDYDLLAAPMLYMLRPGVAERIEQFVQGGGVLVCTTMTGWVDEANRCFLGGWPGPLRNVLGIWTEEIDALYPGETNTVKLAGEVGNLRGEYESRQYCERIHPESASVLATHGRQFYAGEPCVTVRQLGKGKAYYIAARVEQRFLNDLYNGLIHELSLPRALAGELPDGVTAQCRTDGQTDTVFVVNLSGKPATIDLAGEELTDVLDGGTVSGRIELAAHDSRVLSRPAK